MTNADPHEVRRLVAEAGISALPADNNGKFLAPKDFRAFFMIDSKADSIAH